jgi:radical SAM family uncharacterized protein
MDIEKLLEGVQKPARYIGGEWNSVVKEWTAGRTKVLLAFPDLYEIGMSHLGLKILYGLLNERDDILCERSFAPWSDFEKNLRDKGISLFSLESRTALKDFDIIGFSLAYELCYTNVLSMLDLGGIPKRSSERGAGDPLVIAGGPACYNPEPMAEFIDAFLIGDGEEAILEIVQAYKKYREQRTENREELLKRLAKIEGVYVPSLYDVEYNDDGTVRKFYPLTTEASARIKKRAVKDLDTAYYPTKQQVPYIQAVHDRIAIEIMRGCKHACKFCQASALYRPARERTSETVLRIAGEIYRHTGYDEISLLSLSSGDHSRIKEIITSLNAAFEGKAVSVSVPSLRVEDAMTDIPALLSRVRKSGLTFAPEAASERLRCTINKGIDMEKLYSAISHSFRAGWRRVKLYFMIGLPTETDDDILAIADIVKKVSDLRKGVDGRPAEVSVSINTFVPKPHTPFERERMECAEDFERKRAMLRAGLKSKAITLDFHSFDLSRLEAVFSRGDRRLSGVIYNAWAAGCRFDSWRDLFSMARWDDAFKKTNISPDFYASRPRPPSEILPWSFITS